MQDTVREAYDVEFIVPQLLFEVDQILTAQSLHDFRHELTHKPVGRVIIFNIKTRVAFDESTVIRKI